MPSIAMQDHILTKFQNKRFLSELVNKYILKILYFSFKDHAKITMMFF